MKIICDDHVRDIGLRTAFHKIIVKHDHLVRSYQPGNKHVINIKKSPQFLSY